VLTAALAMRLSEQLQRAGAEVLKFDHAIAVSALIAGFASGGDVIDVDVDGGSMSKKPSSFAEVFSAALKSSPEQRAAMLAQVAAQALSIVTHNPEKMPLEHENVADLFAAMKGPAVVKAIAAEFDAKDYFGSVSGEAIVEAVNCAMGADHAAKVAKMDKAGKAKFAIANVPPTGWLPKPLRTAWYTGPVENKAPAKKAAKKAAKKKAKR
jgi:ParB family transcriptional regulator, chromosome partitioning protein